MTIDELKDEFIKLYDAPRFKFNTPIYKRVHDGITEFILKSFREYKGMAKKFQITCYIGQASI